MYPRLTLKKGREKSIIQRHPWIFSGALADKVNAEEGDIVEVFSHDSKLLAYGFYSSKSQISCRLFHWDETTGIDTEAYWQNKLNEAYKLRQGLVANNATNAYRLVHAEGDNIPGLIVDIYNETAILQILIKGIENRKEMICAGLAALGFKNQYIKSKTSSHVLEDIDANSGWLLGESESPTEIKENDLKFLVDYTGGQKTGFFLDQRDNRALLGKVSNGKTVLNTFSYTGGFSLYALAGGATEVHSVDISQDAIAMCDENVKLNFGDDNRHKGFAVDCFEYLKEMPKDYYDIIVLDPPAFAKSAKAVQNAARGYKQINLQAFRRIKAGGLLFTFSCSQNISADLFRKIVFGAAADSYRSVRVIYQLQQPPDHPVSIYHPEGEYLKGLVLYVE